MQGVGDWNEATDIEAKDKKKRGGGFQSFNLEKDVLRGVLRMDYNVPTPIQRKAIPTMMQGNDVVAMARTGSGKTAAFLIPLLNFLKTHSKIVGIRGLIFSPTRELALQILRFGIQLGKYLGLRWAAIVGGNSLDQQFEDLASNPDVVVATPGRLLHIVEEASIKLYNVKCLILDEADRLFELGLQPQIVALMKMIPDNAQRALFSATMPSVLAEFTSAGLTNPIVIRLDAEMKLSDKLKQSAFMVRSEEKLGALIYLLKKLIRVGEKEAQALVFVESKHHVDMLELVMQGYMIPCSAIHGQMDQEARRNAVVAFTKKQTSVMIVTDVAARGLDIPLLDYVINFSFPFTPKLFVHRVGRVARAGRSGTAYSIMTFDDMPYYIDLMDFLGRPICCRQEEGDLLFTADDGCYGRLPEDDIMLEMDFLRRLAHDQIELSQMLKVTDNAHKKYTRTKKKATHDSIQEAKLEEYKYDKIPLHPIFLKTLGADVLAADAAKLDLRKFKAKDSILELIHGEKMFQIKKPETLQSIARSAGATAEERRLRQEARQDLAEGGSGRRLGRPSQSASTAAASPAPAPVAPARKLTLAESLLAKSQERKRPREVSAANADEDDDRVVYFNERAARGAAARHGGSSNTYEDREFFLPTERRDTHDDVHYSVKDATIDITAETAEDASKQRLVYAWNKKKNRYTKMHVNDAKAMLKGMKNEAGKAINFKEKLEAYSKWTKKSNMRIQDVGEEEDLSTVNRAKAARKGTGAEDGNMEAILGEDYVDISDPNQGKKFKMGRKMKKLPKDGQTRTFEELSSMKKKAQKDKAKLAKRQAQKKKRKN